MTRQMLAFFNLPGGTELIIIGVVGLLIFGRRLPDIARSMGKSIVEFKRGLREVKSQIEEASADDQRILPSDTTQASVKATGTKTGEAQVSSDRPAETKAE